VDGLVLGFSRAASNFDDSLTRLVSTVRTVNVSTGVS
jgi:hypothetical protein